MGISRHGWPGDLGGTLETSSSPSRTEIKYCIPDGVFSMIKKIDPKIIGLQSPKLFPILSRVLEMSDNALSSARSRSRSIYRAS